MEDITFFYLASFLIIQIQYILYDYFIYDSPIINAFFKAISPIYPILLAVDKGFMGKELAMVLMQGLICYFFGFIASSLKQKNNI
jgi:hypothetical protein